MTQSRLVFNSNGFKALLTSNGVKAKISAEAEAIASRANANGNTDGFGTSSKIYGDRWVSLVGANTKEARRAEQEGDALSRAVR